MARRFHLLESLGRAALGVGFDLLPGAPLVLTAGKIAGVVVADWSASRGASDRREDLMAVAASAMDEYRGAVDRFVDSLAELSHDKREWLRSYLFALRASVRQRLRSPEDPTGTTVPVNLQLEHPPEVATFLPQRASAFQPGDALPGHESWELAELIGMGAFGEVWRATNGALEGAVKFFVDDSLDLSRNRELTLLARLDSEGLGTRVCRVMDSNPTSRPPWLRYEYVAGGDLAGFLRAWHETDEPPTPLQAARVMRHIVGAVAALHGVSPPIVHRDLKPSNILVAKKGEGEAPRYEFKVADFGIATEQRFENTLTGAGTFQGSGTAGYASNELKAGQPAHPSDDVFALGVIWYELVTGRMGDGPPQGLQFRRDMEAAGYGWVGDMIYHCTEASRDHRHADARELYEELDGQIERAVTSESARGAARPRGPRRVVRALSALALALVWLGAGMGLLVGAAAGTFELVRGNEPAAWLVGAVVFGLYVLATWKLLRRRRRRSAPQAAAEPLQSLA